jgi:hypothetical protein
MIRPFLGQMLKPTGGLRMFWTFFFRRVLAKKNLFVLLMCSFLSADAQSSLSCGECAITSFGAITVYQVFQPRTSFGLGMEAGTWNIKESRFSLFYGASMQWIPIQNSTFKNVGSNDKIRFAAYLKGQMELINRLYLELSPEFVNLSSLDLGAGLRYIVPLTRQMGLGIEPTYWIAQKTCSVNVNLHFAL